MANIPGLTNTIPTVVTDVTTQSRGVSLQGGARVVALVGEGSTTEVLVSTAVGSGKDGLNSSYTSSTGSDGRHFRTSAYPLIENRTVVTKNGATLNGVEATINLSSFSSKYDYRFDPTTGKLELQKAYVVDQGGAFYVPLSTNVGQGTINGLTLMDQNAPNETWTIRCVSVQRNNLNNPIDQTAKFIAFGSLSGAKTDSNGNPILWVANNTTVSNSILSFSISENQTLGVSDYPFREGDAFTVKVASGVLSTDDSLTISYIPEITLNDPQLFTGLNDVVRKHGIPTLDNSLALGAQLAFGAGASQVVCVQAKPSMPKRTSYSLVDSINSTSTNDEEFIFALPENVTPNTDSDIHFFVENNSTGEEEQKLPNKIEFYTVGEPGGPTLTDFINDTTPQPGGYSYCYSVIERIASLSSGNDGYLARDPSFTTKATFSSSEIFDSTAVGKTLRLIDSTNVANVGEFTVSSVTDGKLYILASSFSEFTTEATASFELQDQLTEDVLASESDGTLTKIVSTSEAFFTSTAVDFSIFSDITGKKLKVTGSDDNNGLYDIISYNSGTNTLRIRKTLVSESGIRYELLDSSNTSKYIVVNRDVVPNGYGLRVTIVDEKDAAFFDSGWLAALEALETVECDILSVLPKQTKSVIFQNALNHCKLMSNIRNKKERVLFMGAIQGLTPDNLTGAEDAAIEDLGILEGIQGDSVTEVLAGNVEDLANYSVSDAFGNTFRCLYLMPDEVVINVNGTNTLVDGFYMAPAVAGYVCGDPRIENPITNKVVPGFTILRDKTYKLSVLEALSQAGVCVLQPVTGGGKVIWGKTTTQSGFPEEEELSIVFIRDRVAKVLRSAFAGFIGLPENQNMKAVLMTRAIQVLNALVSQNLLTAYTDVVVEKDSTEPRQFNVSCRVQPNYPTNWIYIKVNVGQL